MRDAWREISRHPRRYAAVLAAIAISTGFLVGSLVFVATSTHALEVSVSERTAGADLVVTAEPDWPVVSRTLQPLPGVAHTEPMLTAYAPFSGPTASGYLALSSLPADPRLRGGRLAEGRWPAAADEVAVSAGTARRYGLTVGRSVSVVDGVVERTYPLRVTGLVAEPRGVLTEGGASGTVTLDFLARWPTSALHLVLVEPDRAAADVAATVREVLPAGTEVSTASAYAQAELEALTDGADLAGIVLLVAGGIALVAGSMIITNTFAIVVVQRRRQIGLLRTLGAARADVRRTLWTEAALVGLAGSAVGVGLGLLFGTAAAGLTGAGATGVVVPWVQVAGAAAAGVVVTLVATVLPTRQATRIPPLAALNAVPEPAAGAPVGRLRTAACAGLVATGALLVVVGFVRPELVPAPVFPPTLLAATVGCALLAFGILAAAPVFLVPVLRGAQRLLRRTPPVVRLAAGNAGRNPRRTAAGTVALMLAVGLIVTLQVGAASARASVLDAVDRGFPVDLAVSNPGGAVGAGLADRVRAVPGVAAVTEVVGTSVVIAGRGPDDGEWPVLGLASDAGPVVAAGFERVRDGVVLAHHYTVEGAGLTEGQRVTLERGSRRLEVTVETSDVAFSGGFVTTAATLARLDAGAPLTQLWAAAAGGADARAVVADVQQVLVAQPGLLLEGSLEQSATLTEVLDTLVLVATALLGVAALIAVIGVGNTLGLSVLERGRESALLRALGLQRRQFYATLAGEAVLLALVGAVVGVAAGVLFGAVGAAAMLRDLGPLRLAVPVPDVAAVVAVAVLAAVLASVLPARRAAREAPVAAPAAE